MGRLVFNFNSLERVVHRTLLMLATKGTEDEAVSAIVTHMNNIPATDALRSVATDFYDGWIREHCLHLCELFDRLREHRNYMVHGFKDIRVDGRATISTTTARKGLKDHELVVGAAELRTLASLMHRANGYAAHVYCCAAEIIHDRVRKTPIPELYPLPDRLQKPTETRAERKLRQKEQNAAIERYLGVRAYKPE
jgi:hypothetical protein